MYGKKYRSRAPRRFARKTVYRKKAVRRPRVSSNLNKPIKTVIRRNEETKSQSYSSNDLPIGIYNVINGTLTNVDLSNVMLSVTQGVGQGQRIGNKISVTQLKLHGYVSCENAQVLTNAYFRLVVLKSRPQNAQSTYAGLYQTGNTQSSPTGTLLDNIREFNKDFFQIYSSKILGPFGSVSASYSTMASSQTSIAKKFSFNLTKHVNSVIFNDSVTAPTNFSMFMVILPCNADGSQITTPQVANYSYTYDIELKYKDA